MMHSRVECEDEVSGEKHVLTLVFPAKPMSMKARSPCWPRSAVPARPAIGQSIDWNAPGGRKLRWRDRGPQRPPLITAAHRARFDPLHQEP